MALILLAAWAMSSSRLMSGASVMVSIVLLIPTLLGSRVVVMHDGGRKNS
jgi:hypothetical protein